MPDANSMNVHASAACLPISRILCTQGLGSHRRSSSNASYGAYILPGTAQQAALHESVFTTAASITLYKLILPGVKGTVREIATCHGFGGSMLSDSDATLHYTKS
jgi:hypothetical protein